MASHNIEYVTNKINDSLTKLSMYQLIRGGSGGFGDGKITSTLNIVPIHPLCDVLVMSLHFEHMTGDDFVTVSRNNTFNYRLMFNDADNYIDFVVLLLGHIKIIETAHEKLSQIFDVKLWGDLSIYKPHTKHRDLVYQVIYGMNGKFMVSKIGVDETNQCETIDEAIKIILDKNPKMKVKSWFGVFG